MKKKIMNKRVYALVLTALMSVPAMTYANTYSEQQKEAETKVAETTKAEEVMSAVSIQKSSVMSANQEKETTNGETQLPSALLLDGTETVTVETQEEDTETTQNEETVETTETVEMTEETTETVETAKETTENNETTENETTESAETTEDTKNTESIETTEATETDTISSEPEEPSEAQPTEEDSEEPAEETQPASEFDKIAVSRVSDYVNVRSIPSTEGEILGKIYDGCAATILEVVDDWYRIESGSVEGYIKAEFFVTGAEAEALASELATEFGVVNTVTLRVRADASLESDCIDMVAGGSEFVVEEEKDGWGKIELDNTTKGWVSLEYLDTRVEFDTAISIEEEQAKLEEQRLAEERAAEARRRAEEAAAAASRAANNNTSSTTNNTPSTPAPTAPASEPTQSASSISEASSSLREAITTYALQFVGNPYVYGGNSLTNGTDCSGFVKLIYAEFGYSLERRASLQYANNGTKISVEELRPGDLVFYGSGEVEHVAMYIGDGRIVHASTSRTGIITANLYYRTPYGAVRIIND